MKTIPDYLYQIFYQMVFYEKYFTLLFFNPALCRHLFIFPQHYRLFYR